MLEVTEADPLDDHRLRVAFNDGIVRVIDCTFLMHGTLGEPLRDPGYFCQVRVDTELRTVVWPNGLDPAPELLYGDLGAGTAKEPAGASRAGRDG